MTAWLVLGAVAAAVVGVLAKVGRDMARAVRADRAAHGGRMTRDTAYKLWGLIAAVALLIVVLIVWPLLLGGGAEPLVPEREP